MTFFPSNFSSNLSSENPFKNYSNSQKTTRKGICDFRENAVIVVDTREGLPYTFPEYRTTREKLDTGDYSVLGMESQICLERKTIDDFLGSILTKNRDRFFREIKRMTSAARAAIIVEANWNDIITGNYPRASSRSLDSIVGTVACIQIDFGIPIHFLSDRQSAQFWALKILERSWRQLSSNN